MIIENSSFLSRSTARFGWLAGLTLVAAGSAGLLLQWCAQCLHTDWITAVVLPVVGIMFAALVAWLSLHKKASAGTKAQYRTLVVLCAGIVTPIPLGLMALGFQTCNLCILVWIGVSILFILETTVGSWLAKTATVAWLASLVLSLVIWRNQVMNLEAKGALISLGLRSPIPENGPAIGKQMPPDPPLPATARVLFWTNCPCPLDAVQQVLTHLAKQGESPIIVCLSERPEMKAWSPRSQIYVVSPEVFSAWEISPTLPHTFVRTQDGKVTSNRAVTDLLKDQEK